MICGTEAQAGPYNVVISIPIFSLTSTIQISTVLVHQAGMLERI